MSSINFLLNPTGISHSVLPEPVEVRNACEEKTNKMGVNFLIDTSSNHLTQPEANTIQTTPTSPEQPPLVSMSTNIPTLLYKQATTINIDDNYEWTNERKSALIKIAREVYLQQNNAWDWNIVSKVMTGRVRNAEKLKMKYQQLTACENLPHHPHSVSNNVNSQPSTNTALTTAKVNTVAKRKPQTVKPSVKWTKSLDKRLLQLVGNAQSTSEKINWDKITKKLFKDKTNIKACKERFAELKRKKNDESNSTNSQKTSSQSSLKMLADAALGSQTMTSPLTLPSQPQQPQQPVQQYCMTPMPIPLQQPPQYFIQQPFQQSFQQPIQQPFQPPVYFVSPQQQQQQMMMPFPQSPYIFPQPMQPLQQMPMFQPLQNQLHAPYMLNNSGIAPQPMMQQMHPASTSSSSATVINLNWPPQH